MELFEAVRGPFNTFIRRGSRENFECIGGRQTIWIMSWRLVYFFQVRCSSQ